MQGPRADHPRPKVQTKYEADGLQHEGPQTIRTARTKTKQMGARRVGAKTKTTPATRTKTKTKRMDD
jgi:hypothetical protein